MNRNIRVRFAPSPTGALHIGGGHYLTGYGRDTTTENLFYELKILI